MKESINNKVEKTIRFDNYEVAIEKCTKICNDHLYNVLHHIDKLLYERDGQSDDITEHNLIVEIRAKIIYPLIVESAQEYPDWDHIEEKI